MVSNRRLALVALIAAAIAAAVLMRPKPIDVEVTRVVRAPLTVTVDEEGETRVRERYVVAAPVSGRLERITLDEGAAVRAGDVVARMHPQPLDPRLAAEARAQLDAAEAARREAEAKVAQARAALTQAQRNADRARRLAKDGTISKEELEQANLEQISQQQQLAAAEHATTRAEHEVRAAEAALIASGSRDTGSPPAGGGIEITAPADGSVLRVFEESERVISVGTPLLSIGNPHDLEIVVDVLSKDAVLIGPGSRVIIEEWGGPNPLEARVRYVEPAGFTKVSALGVEEQRVNVIIDLTA
ncbi:MAG TPA: HlyD family efflux transporter periplasmic adaptor subunit, partial [Terriglobales bacterium]|nr:HlyD family efflux transporter periplasmic adaptor subunit [Terriglobales bacterium]